VRWGIAGPGWVARDFIAPVIDARENSEISACIASSLAKGNDFAQEFQVPHVHEHMSDFVADADIDAIYIALPNALHHQAVLAAARAGKHILCEKPFALTIEHALEMTQACKAAGVILRIAHQIRLDSAIAHAREVVASGALGRLVSISVERASGLTVRPPWREDVTQSGVIFDVGVHLLDLVQWISGERYKAVSAFSHPDRRQGIPDDTVTVLGELENGCQAIIRATRESATAENNLIIQGTEASLKTSALRFASEHCVQISNGREQSETRFPASKAYALEIEAFETELHGGSSALPDGINSSLTVAVTQAVLASIEEQQIVTVNYP
jgi:1,5-anhydro-D-fructose reductase (1,5-anhydro-D-mannitol-forming)